MKCGWDPEKYCCHFFCWFLEMVRSVLAIFPELGFGLQRGCPTCQICMYTISLTTICYKALQRPVLCVIRKHLPASFLVRATSTFLSDWLIWMLKQPVCLTIFLCMFLSVRVGFSCISVVICWSFIVASVVAFTNIMPVSVFLLLTYFECGWVFMVYIQHTC